ncbi:hypothetical protein BDV96DRAFT_140703 [Lophiotrema nucula]|uniref:Uncharacterized protein n=1 Tax=Lophiotrema nucula TaxID=690887 RepID=A0A6A5ZT50_9PLEO|nr:hypothetical protein BDV96DRAFT_140703 [Lophiotrema nucula]
MTATAAASTERCRSICRQAPHVVSKGRFAACDLAAGLRTPEIRAKTPTACKVRNLHPNSETNLLRVLDTAFCITEEIFRATAKSSKVKFEASTFSPFHLYCTVVHSDSHEDLFDRSRASAEMLYNPDNSTLGSLDLKAWLRDFCDVQSATIPFVALDSELVGTFARAKALARKVNADQISIAVVDTRVVGADSLVSCNTLRGAMGIGQYDKYATKVLAWADLPAEAVKCCMPWSKIVNGVIGKEWFSILGCASSPREKSWIEHSDMFSARTQEDEINVPEMFQSLESAFGMRGEDEETRLVVETFIAWKLGYVQLQECKRDDILIRHSDAIDEWIAITQAVRRHSTLVLNPPESDPESVEEDVDRANARIQLLAQERNIDDDDNDYDDDRISYRALGMLRTPVEITQSSGNSMRVNPAFDLVVRDKRSNMRLSSYLSNDSLSVARKKDCEKRTRCNKVYQRASSRALSHGREPLLDDSDDNIFDSLSDSWAAKRSDSATVVTPPAQLQSPNSPEQDSHAVEEDGNLGPCLL